jgi:plasmid stabilization system protein ParE
MPADGLPNDAEIVAGAYAERLRDLFKVLAESIYTGEPERDAIVRFRRGLVSARRAYAAALEAVKDVDKG